MVGIGAFPVLMRTRRIIRTFLVLPGNYFRISTIFKPVPQLLETFMFFKVERI